jgi:diguanylate cyclase (GGDEF)-like protein/PAS domain S-box-containing protein
MAQNSSPLMALRQLGQQIDGDWDDIDGIGTVLQQAAQVLGGDCVQVLEFLEDRYTARLYSSARLTQRVECTVITADREALLRSLKDHPDSLLLQTPTPQLGQQPTLWPSSGNDGQNVTLIIPAPGQPLGLLSVFLKDSRHLTESEHLFLHGVTHLLASLLVHHQVGRLQTYTIALEERNHHLHHQILQLQRIEAILRESEERYALAANATQDGIWDWNLETDGVYFSQRWTEMLGYASDQIRPELEEWLLHIHPEDREKFQQAVTLHCHGLTSCLEVQYRLLHQDGSYRWMLARGLAIRDGSGQVQRLAGCQSDITERKHNEEQLVYYALHDALTGLANRSLFMDRLNRALALTKRHQDYEFAVIFLDLDRFKLVNDSLGHRLGDELLVEVAKRLKSCLRVSDTCARWGGDEFAILLEYIADSRDAIKVVKRIQTQLKRPIDLSGHKVTIDASMGIILSTLEYQHPEGALRDVDTAMAHAKALGRGHYVIFTQEMHAQTLALLRLEHDLQQAIARQEFFLVYQPIVDLRTNCLRGFEALVRWQHPERGLVSPAEFIPIAEETGLIVPLGWWVLRQACEQMRQWQIRYPLCPPLTISVNISPRQFCQADVVQQVQTILTETHLTPSCLKLEITESALMEDTQQAIELMQQLKNLRVLLVMDDFGTGYSSLSHLHLFPIDTLKIDSSFVHKVDTDLEKVEILRSVISLAWNLGMDIVAEGIETKQQMYQLRLLNCDLAQGYLFAKPLIPEHAAVWIDELYHRHYG